MIERMHKSFSTLGYFFAALLLVGFFARSLDFLLARVDPKQNTSGKLEAYLNEEGGLKYASGACSVDADCVPTGCSLEYCGSEGVASTCEVKADHPANAGFKCGCLGQTCAWTK